MNSKQNKLDKNDNECKNELIVKIRELQDEIEINNDERKFLNGLVRKYKPKKIVEIGVSAGGTAVLMLNAIKDIPESKLYSIDRSETWCVLASRKTGWLVKEKFLELMVKWTLFIGNTAEFTEKIGNNIEFVYIDTVHQTPGEMLHWLEILPFLKEEAIVVFHDIYLMFAGSVYQKTLLNYSNNQLLCYIRRQLILPSYGDKPFSRNIGALKLDKNQKRYYKQYFLALGNQWFYKPDEKDLEILRSYFKKYYGDKLVEIYDDAVETLCKLRQHGAKNILLSNNYPELRIVLKTLDIEKYLTEHKIDHYTLEDIIKCLKQPNRDFRDDFTKPLLKSNILKIEDLLVKHIYV